MAVGRKETESAKIVIASMGMGFEVKRRINLPISGVRRQGASATFEALMFVRSAAARIGQNAVCTDGYLFI